MAKYTLTLFFMGFLMDVRFIRGKGMGGGGGGGGGGRWCKNCPPMVIIWNTQMKWNFAQT